MLCKIADLITEVPDAGSMAPRCEEYQWHEDQHPDIAIDAKEYDPTRYPAFWNQESVAYMESARFFYRQLLDHDGFYLHSSAIALDGKAYLFSGPSGMGKSTHTRLWQQIFGSAAQVFNDDKPALRCLDGVWYAYGTPWCGKDHINVNRKVPLAGICFLEQSSENVIRRLPQAEAAMRIISQTIRYFANEERLDLMLNHVQRLVKTIPVYELKNRPEPAAAMLSFETMLAGAKENGL